MDTPAGIPTPTDSSAPADAADESSAQEETTEEGDAQLSAAPKSETPKTASQKKKLKLKVDGEEFEEELDWDNEDDLRKKLQYSKVGQKRMQQHAALEREVEEFLTQLKTNPRKVLSDPRIGLDIKKLAAEVIEEEIENSKKSPEQIEKEQLQARLSELEDERKREKEESRSREMERLQTQEFERYDMLMSKALEKSDLPKSPYIVKKMADYMLMGLNNGLDVTPDDVLPLVREEITNDLKDMFAVMPDEVIEAIVGKDVFNRVRKKNVAKAKSSPPQPLKASVKDSGQKSAAKTPEAKKISYKDFFNI